MEEQEKKIRTTVYLSEGAIKKSDTKVINNKKELKNRSNYIEKRINEDE